MRSFKGIEILQLISLEVREKKEGVVNGVLILEFGRKLIIEMTGITNSAPRPMRDAEANDGWETQAREGLAADLLTL
jgi:hypothetical protein